MSSLTHRARTLFLLLSSSVSATRQVLQTACSYALQTASLQRQSYSFSAWEADVLQTQRKDTNTAQRYAACTLQSTRFLPVTIILILNAMCSTSMSALQAKTLMNSTAVQLNSMACITSKAWLVK